MLKRFQAHSPLYTSQTHTRLSTRKGETTLSQSCTHIYLVTALDTSCLENKGWVGWAWFVLLKTDVTNTIFTDLFIMHNIHIDKTKNAN